MFCHKCGAAVNTNVRFCPACGQSLEAAGGAPSAPAAWTPPVGVKAQSGRWISEGWQMVKADIWTYILAALLFMIVGSVGSFITQGPMLAGFHIFCMKKLSNRNADLGDIFKGFNYFVPALVASLLIGLFVFAGTLLCLIPGLVVAAMFKFTHLFIVDKRMEFWPAMQASHAVVKNDYVGFSLFLIVLFLVNVLGCLCLLVGLFVSVPVTIAAITVAYKEAVGFEPATLDAL